MPTWYAWSPINSAEAKEDGKTVTVKPGDTVTADKLFLDDAQWKQLVESGAVRTMAYPDMPDTWQGSPVDFYLSEAKKASENALTSVSESADVVNAAAMANAASSGDPDAQALAVEQPTADEINAPPPPDANGGNGQ